MTDDQTGTDAGMFSSHKALWPMVVMVGMGLAAVVAILIFAPAQNAAVATAVPAILALLGSLAGAGWVAGKVSDVKAGVARVDEKVNGHLTALTSKIPDASGGTTSEPNSGSSV